MNSESPVISIAVNEENSLLVTTSFKIANGFGPFPVTDIDPFEEGIGHAAFVLASRLEEIIGVQAVMAIESQSMLILCDYGVDPVTLDGLIRQVLLETYQTQQPS